MKNLNQKCKKKEKRIAKFSNFKMRMGLKIKIFAYNLYPFNIDLCFKHEIISCTLLKLFTLSKFENLDGFRQYNYLQLYTHLYGERKDNGMMVSISKYPQ
jgi:hypothetical protein